MKNKDQIIEDLLRSKAEMMADRNERFAIIQDELEDLRKRLNSRMGALLRKFNDTLSNLD